MNDTDRNEIKELKRQILSLKAQLDTLHHRNNTLTGGQLLHSEAIDYFPGEQLDFVLSILEQAKSRCEPDSRAYDLLSSLLTVNRPVGRGREILEEVTRIFQKGYPDKASDIANLQSLGFTYTQSKKHPKLRFHDKYMFVLPSTPSDNRRGAKNSLADISKCLAISQKF